MIFYDLFVRFKVIKLANTDASAALYHNDRHTDCTTVSVEGCETYYKPPHTSYCVKSFFKMPESKIVKCFLPLHDASSLKMLRLYVKTAVKVGNLDIFESSAVKVALIYAWESYGKAQHLEHTVMYLIFVAIFTTSSLAFNYLLKHNEATITLAWILEGLVLLFMIYYISHEIKQACSGLADRNRHHHTSAVWSIVSTFYNGLRTDVWNIVDILVIIFTLWGTILRCIYTSDYYSSRCVLSVASIFVWFKILYFLRPFPSSGPLVSMVMIIMHEMSFCIDISMCIMWFCIVFLVYVIS